MGMSFLEYLAEFSRYTAKEAAANIRERIKKCMEELTDYVEAVSEFENDDQNSEAVLWCIESLLGTLDEARDRLQDTYDCVSLDMVACMHKENAELKTKLQEVLHG